MQDKTERRRHFRLRFPAKDHPTISIEGTEFDVFEISESGIRISMKETVEFKSSKVKGDLCFADGSATRVIGTIIRKENDSVVLAHVEGLSFGLIMQEQMRLLRKYPMLSF